MSTAWLTNADFEHDLDFYSVIGASIETIQDTPPPSILEYNARIGANRNSSIYDTPELTEDNRTYICSGRGRGRGSFNIFRPGITVPNNSNDDEDDIRRRLKAVNGIGYSNEVIEEQFRHKRMKSKKPKNDDIEFSDVPEIMEKSASSSYSSVENSPRRNQKVNSGSTSSQSTSPSLGSAVTNGLHHSGTPIDLDTSFLSTDSNPCIIEEEITIINDSTFPPLQSDSPSSSRPESVHLTRDISSSTTPLPTVTQSPVTAHAPLPLSVIRNLAKKDKKCPEKTVVNRSPINNIGKKSPNNVTNDVNGNINGHESPAISVPPDNDYWWNREEQSNNSDDFLSWRRRDVHSPPRSFHWRRDLIRHQNNFDIQSSKDFPALRGH